MEGVVANATQMRHGRKRCTYWSGLLVVVEVAVTVAVAAVVVDAWAGNNGALGRCLVKMFCFFFNNWCIVKICLKENLGKYCKKLTLWQRLHIGQLCVSCYSEWLLTANTYGKCLPRQMLNMRDVVANIFLLGVCYLMLSDDDVVMLHYTNVISMYLML